MQDLDSAPTAARSPFDAPLSAELRAATGRLHRQTEQRLGLPGSIGSLAAYGAWLGRFLGLHEPLEAGWNGFTEWHGLGLSVPSRIRAPCLHHDLTALGIAARDLPRADIAPPPSFAHALGQMYVLEGATLGGRVILRDLQARLGPRSLSATRFFGGRGAATGPMWQSFRAGLDAFGEARPRERALVLAGAEDAFCATLEWFTPFCSAAAGLPA